MTRDELIEEAARIIHADCARGLAIYPNHTARKVAALFFAALKEPTKEMDKAGFDNDGVGYIGENHTLHEPTWVWQAMLNASPLAPEGGKDC